MKISPERPAPLRISRGVNPFSRASVQLVSGGRTTAAGSTADFIQLIVLNRLLLVVLEVLGVFHSNLFRVNRTHASGKDRRVMIIIQLSWVGS